MGKSLKATQIENFDPSVYGEIGYDELTTYAIYSLLRKDEEATFESIVAEAFLLFPRRFSLRGYPEWPDASVVNKSWLRCRTDKHYIEGSVKASFKLTIKGLQAAKNVEKRLLGTNKEGNSGEEIKAELRTRAGRLLNALEKSKAYAYFRKAGNLDDIKDHDLTDMLMCMPDSETKVIKHNIEQFNQAAELYNRQDILDLLAVASYRLLGVKHKRGR